MTDSMITVSDGTNFFRIPLGDLEEACADGFYVPALRGRAIVSDGQELFEIPAEDVADAEADGFRDILTAEADLVETLRSRLVATDPAESFPMPQDEIPDFAASMSLTTATVAAKPAAARNKKGKKTVEPAAVPTTATVEVTPPVADLSEEAASEPEGPKTFADRMRALLHPTADQKRKIGVFATNVAVHAGVIFVMAAIFLPNEYKEDFLIITSSIEPTESTDETIEPTELGQPLELSEPNPTSETFVDSQIESMDVVDVDINDLELSSMAVTIDRNSIGSVALPKGEMGGRSKAGRQAMVSKMGGTTGSEIAVQKGLEWIKRHQAEDGGWSFDHTGGECKGACSQPGSLGSNCRNAATGFALLAMLGAGNTPFEGEFQETVLKGINFLLKNSSTVPAGLDLRGIHAPNTGMYTHAIATTALCETLAMLRHEVKAPREEGSRASNRQRLQLIRQMEPVCAAAVNFIVAAQHPTNGSWGYNPGASGDTSILGWQVMALKSAAHAEIPFNVNAVIGANTFLNFVQSEDGGYGYAGNSPTPPSTTAIGIVCRMLSGMPRTEPRLQAAVARLSAAGPARDNMYYNYYATQVMLNYGGETWTKWNEQMREQLVSTRIKDGHAEGSWDLSDAHGGVAGRLYMTSLCTMTLEVYYRHLPLYGMPEEAEVAAKDEKPEK